MRREAVISECGKYRYTLYREWADEDEVDALVFGVRVLNFVMLNPSTADGKEDDPTVRKCMGFARRNRYNAIRIVNLFAFRATDPKDLQKEYVNGGDVIGPSNDAYVRELPPEETVCVAWGATFQNETFVRRRVQGTITLLDRKLWCLRKTKDGHPGHPVMLGYRPLIEF